VCECADSKQKEEKHVAVMKNDMYASGKESRMCHEKRGKNNVSKTTAVYVDGDTATDGCGVSKVQSDVVRDPKSETETKAKTMHARADARHGVHGVMYILDWRR
jgi:hypothetical protein